ncbi:MAG: accessory factor UbiK family protein [Gammaproteobacteria bacterium]|jgi:BMFP domain-containing protein YqiC|nr:accessory factor UbiK family protein [Gammaproteobacteria bacterium]
MMDLRFIDDLTRRLGEALPPGVTQRKEELEAQFRTVLTTAFERMNLVSREEFDDRCRVLEETRAKLAELEQRLEELDAG